ncbi:MAG: flagellar basal body rod protein FlgC [Candidatus Binatia bacterium]
MMELNRTLSISASALRAERMRLDVIASNLANVATTRTPEGGPYRRRAAVFTSEPIESPFGDALAALGQDGEALRGVGVANVVEDQTPPRMVFEPGNPDADAQGYVAYPNVNPVLEMVDLTAASRAMRRTCR